MRNLDVVQIGAGKIHSCIGIPIDCIALAKCGSDISSIHASRTGVNYSGPRSLTEAPVTCRVQGKNVGTVRCWIVAGDGDVILVRHSNVD